MTIKNTLEIYGALRDMGAQLRQKNGKGMVKVSYYDLRDAKSCVSCLHGTTKWGRRLDVRFCGVDGIVGGGGGGGMVNQGTLVVFNLESGFKADDVRRLFGVYGDVKEIRETPNKRFHKFVEFFDVRDAERAMVCLNRSEVGGKRIKIEVSRPGGRGIVGGKGDEGGVVGVGGGCGSPRRRGGGGSGGGGWGSPGGGGDRVSGRFVLDIEKVFRGEDVRTALMIRNIPNKYNQKMLVAALEENHKGHFDFLYLPIDFKNKCNVGYAFINFIEPRYIPGFYQEFHGKKWYRFNSEKICCITYARIQGKGNLIAHFQNSSLMNEDPKCQPVVFDHQGRREEFPVGAHVRTRRGPSSREARSLENSPHCSPRATQHHHHFHHHHTHRR